MKGKEEKECYTHLNAEFRRTARRDKKAFLSEQYKEKEENNRMGKNRDLFNKIRYTKGIFHAKMGTIKDRNSMDLTEAEDKKRWQEYTEEVYKKNIFVTKSQYLLFQKAKFLQIKRPYPRAILSPSVSQSVQ